MGCWLAAQMAWWWHLFIHQGGPPTPKVAAALHVGFLLLALAALIALAASTAGSGALREKWTTHAVVVLVLDGLVAAAAYAVLVWSSRVSGGGSFDIARSGGRPDGIGYPLLSLIVVVVAVLLTLGYREGRRYRANFFLLASGVVTIAAADRLVAYLVGVGFGAEQHWARAGFVLGPLLIALALAERRPALRERRSARPLDWAQMLPPYVGTLGIAALLGFHVLVGQQIDGVQTGVCVLLSFMLVARQLVALEDNRLLVRKICAGQQQLLHQLRHDALTGLPNRILFAERLDAALAEEVPFVLVYIDIDDFKDVNDRYGHSAGDHLLDLVGQRLRGAARASDTVARIGGDEFGVLIHGNTGSPEVFADRLRTALRPPFALHGNPVTVRASMGLVLSDPDSPRLSSDDLLRRADDSMYVGKRQGKDAAVLYPHATQLNDFPSALRRANGGVPEGFHLAYQPIVRLPEATLVAVEALARWTAPNGARIAPETFVAAAESAGLGLDFDTMVLELALSEAEVAGLDLVVQVNVGAARLADPAFVRAVADALERHAVEPRLLVLEITESLPIVDLAEGAAAIRRLRELGVVVALDDFGAGYNSLTYLHALPVDIAKLDRTLTIGIEPSRDAALYRSVVGVCDELGFEVVAEGIETAAQAHTVHAAGCRLAQGFLFGRAVPISEIVAVTSATVPFAEVSAP